jgi:hypothetical protein
VRLCAWLFGVCGVCVVRGSLVGCVWFGWVGGCVGGCVLVVVCGCVCGGDGVGMCVKGWCGDMWGCVCLCVHMCVCACVGLSLVVGWVDAE